MPFIFSVLDSMAQDSVTLGSESLVLEFCDPRAFVSSSVILSFAICSDGGLWFYRLDFGSDNSEFWAILLFWELYHVYSSSSPKAGVGEEKQIPTFHPHPQLLWRMLSPPHKRQLVKGNPFTFPFYPLYSPSHSNFCKAEHIYLSQALPIPKQWMAWVGHFSQQTGSLSWNNLRACPLLKKK